MDGLNQFPRNFLFCQDLVGITIGISRSFSVRPTAHFALRMLVADASEDDYIALIVVGLALASFVSSNLARRSLPKIFFPRRFKKERQIQALRKQLHSSASDFVAVSKMERKIVVAERELQQINEEYRAQRLHRWIVTTFPWIVRYLYVIPCVKLFGDRPDLVMIPQFMWTWWARLFGWATSFFAREAPHDEESRRSIGVLSWIVIVHVAIHFLTRSFHSGR